MSQDSDPGRPNPDDLITEVTRESRGRLKIYLGMAPGVGKTFAMLEAAQRLKAQGADVVVGLVETHGRQETEDLVLGLDVLPRRAVTYRGVKLYEFDIDAALARHPALILVDELAHTNAPGCRHPKRWQDIYELLDAGINVHTTLNIQHIEGLTDVVARITGIRVQETLPEAVVEGADEVEFVDLTPDDLVERLADGKVYTATLAGRARESFFRRGNLTALRELALRLTAEHVDSQMTRYMRTHAIAGPWPVSERLMACIGPDGSGTRIVRAAKRAAEQLRCPWAAVHVEIPGLDTSRSSSVAEALSLAERLGGHAERLTGNDIPGEILAYARRRNITQIVTGRSRGGWLRTALRRSLVHELVRRSEGITIHVITDAPERKRPRLKVTHWPDMTALGIALIGTGAVVALAQAFPELRESRNVSMLFLTAVLFIAVRLGTGAALISAVTSFLAYNFFFTEPYHTFRVSHWHDIVALGTFLAIATTAGTLAGRVRDQMRAARSRISALQALYDFSRRLGASKTSDDLVHAIVVRSHQLAEAPALMLLPEGDDLALRYAWPPDPTLDDTAWAAARWCLRHAQHAGAGTGTLPLSSWHFRPMRTAKGVGGVLGMLSPGELPRADILPTLDAMLDQAAVAIERIGLAVEAARAASAAESERFRNAMLSSISHDLRTPLTSILGSVTALINDAPRYDAATRNDLLATIKEEAERLDRYVANLLEITRLEAGVLEIKRDWLVVSEVVDSAIRRTKSQFTKLSLRRMIAAGLPLLRADFVLLETVLINLLDNAAKHATGASAVEITANASRAGIVIAVTDDGNGIPADQLPRLFEKFYRVYQGDRTVSGTGLGLTICKGLVEAMGGTISALSPVKDARGTSIELHFPIESQPPIKLTDGNL